jgi:hypothetical protein
MTRVGEFLVHRGAPLAAGFLALDFWGSDTRNRETIVFVLAMFVTHCVLSLFSISRAVDKVDERLARQSGSEALS